MDGQKYYAKPDKTIKEHSDELLIALEELSRLGYITSESVRKLTEIACTYHDYGKANPAFQERVKIEGKRFDDNTEVAHNVLSLYFLPREIFETEEDYFKVANAILNHHDYCDTMEILQNDVKKELILKLLLNFKDEIKKVTPKQIKKISRIIEEQNKEAVLVKGFLHKCDYSASAGMRIEYPNNFLEEKMNGLYKWNELQEFCKANASENIIAIAQTGMGKTEAGLLWLGNQKGFFILPIRTAINAIYQRIKDDILHEENIEERLALLHSDALEYYDKHINTKELDLVDYYERGKKLSMPLTICTMDQLFDFVFKYNGYEMKLATLSYAKIVLDEIQMYSPELLAYLICGIQKISEFGGKLAIVTATLPPFIRDEIVSALGNEVKEETFTDDKKRHNIKVISDKLKADMIVNVYKENEQNKVSNKILVVCNTIKRAQEIYLELRKKLEEQVEINLLHARFLKEHRDEKEKSILDFGKTYLEGNILDCQSGIWISTSIVEASLDIDFDYLFTELQDLNSLFQRFGRCNRKGRKGVEFTNCYVFTQIDMGKNIDEHIYNLSKSAIENVDGILTEQKKIQLIQDNFTREKVCESKYFEKYHQSKYRIQNMAPYEIMKSEVDLRNIFSISVIPKPIYDVNEQEIINCIEKLDEERDLITKAKCREFIRSLTVSIPGYILEKGKKNIYKTIPISRYEKISIFECQYDNELGFRELITRETSFL